MPWPRFLLVAFTALGCASTATDSFQRPGLAVLAGTGHETPALGIEWLYYVARPGRPWQLAPRAGLGALSAGSSTTVGVSAGLSAIYGRSHRGVVDAGFASLTYATLRLHGTEVDTHVGHGPTAAAGYEYVSPGGIVVRLLGGAAVQLGPIVTGSRLMGIASLGCGRKF